MNNKEDNILNVLDTHLNSKKITGGEIRQIQKILRSEMEENDTINIDVLGKVAFIIEQKSHVSDVEELHGLVNDVIRYGKLLGHDFAVDCAKKVELLIAAKFIDDGRYNDFKAMVHIGFDPYFEGNKNLMDNVKTLKGAKFMEIEGLIPEGYFTKSRNDEAPLLRAYPEQINFYIEQGAKVDACDRFGQDVLHHMLYRSYPPESIEKVIKAGAQVNPDDFELLLDRIGWEYDKQVKYFGDKGIKRTLDNIEVLVKHGGCNISDNSYRGVSGKIVLNLIENSPEHLSTFLKMFPKKDLYGLKEMAMQAKLFTAGFFSSTEAPMGETADTKTNKVEASNKRTADIQTKIAKAFMSRSKEVS